MFMHAWRVLMVQTGVPNFSTTVTLVVVYTCSYTNTCIHNQTHSHITCVFSLLVRSVRNVAVDGLWGNALVCG